MCLTKADKQINKEICKTGEGWKVFIPGEVNKKARYFGIFFPSHDEEGLEPNIWHTANKNSLPNVTIGKATDKDRKEFVVNADGQKYVPGFHIFTSEADAVDYAAGGLCVIRKVKYKNVLATGKQGVYPCLVAEQMMILETKLTKSKKVKSDEN